MILANQCIGRILFIAIKGKQPDFLNMEGEASGKLSYPFQTWYLKLYFSFYL
jgi:hypothetical protein